MADPIQNIPLGLLSVLPPPIGPLAMAGAQQAPRTAPREARPQRGQGLLPNLFNQQPSGYTPDDVRKVMEDQAGYWQRFPITPQWNGGRGAGGVLPGIANFGSGFMGSYTQGQQADAARENERIRRGAADAASNAPDLETAVRALQGGSPEQSNAAMQVHLQNLVKEQERQRQAAVMQQIYGAPPEAQAPTTAPAAPPAAPTTPAAQPAPQIPVAAPPPSAPPAPAPPAALPNPGTDFMMPPSGGGAAPQASPQHILTIDGMNSQQIDQRLARENAATRPADRPSAPTAAPTPQPQAAQSEPIVQIGQFRLPLSEARRRAAVGRAQGIDVKPLEEAISLAEVPLQAAGRERGRALGEAQTGLPQSIQAAQSTIEKIDEITNDPQLDRIIGWSAYNPAGYLPYTPEQRGLVARIQQVQGRFFLQAFDALRGGGQITEKEGQKAQEAIARIMDLNQDIGSYRIALEDARREVWSLTNIARTRAGLQPIPYQPSQPPAQQGGQGRNQTGPVAPGNYMWTPDGGLQRQ
jgi:hypothetical protein